MADPNENDLETLRALIAGLGQGYTANLLDEAVVGPMGALYSEITDPYGKNEPEDIFRKEGEVPSFKERMQNATNDYRDYEKELQNKHPIAHTVGGFGGALRSPLNKVLPGAGASANARLGAMAGLGGLYGYGGSEKSGLETLPDIGKGAATAGFLQSVGEGALGPLSAYAGQKLPTALVESLASEGDLAALAKKRSKGMISDLNEESLRTGSKYLGSVLNQMQAEEAANREFMTAAKELAKQPPSAAKDYAGAALRNGRNADIKAAQDLKNAEVSADAAALQKLMRGIAKSPTGAPGKSAYPSLSPEIKSTDTGLGDKLYTAVKQPITEQQLGQFKEELGQGLLDTGFSPQDYWTQAGASRKLGQLLDRENQSIANARNLSKEGREAVPLFKSGSPESLMNHKPNQYLQDMLDINTKGAGLGPKVLDSMSRSQQAFQNAPANGYNPTMATTEALLDNWLGNGSNPLVEEALKRLNDSEE